ncbi:trichothecene 3-o-acetyltransferase [Fusarium sporotrichioides]|uniref:Trichothecene 3-o-acetyltransferase n=1 Tax=Fusarium sporotrichioides TaxID=5514 RepID=A0A395RUZ4_FUSSP|nr:trichothecene 3-o-acetyltransferase [Fusarium sporotrichioides]
MTDRREINVRPVGVGKDAPDEIFQLSDLDHLMPKLYVHMIEIFELPQNIPNDTIINRLIVGLERALADYPILTGTLHFDNDTKRIVVKRQADSSLRLHIKTATTHDIPSFSVLDKNDFPVHVLDAPKVLPDAFVGARFPVPGLDTSVSGPAVGGAQITFIEGGIIIGLAITHQVCDGPGFENFLTIWSKHASQAARGESINGLSESKAEIPSRDIFTLQEKPKITSEEQERLIVKFPTMKLRDDPPAPPPADFKLPVVKTRIWHFPKSKLQTLKAQCSVGLEPGTWISTYDAILSTMWRATVRAKSSLLKPEPNAPSKAVHAVNGRGRTGWPISDKYIGTAITMPQSEKLTVAEVLGDLETTLPVLARRVRESTNSVNPEYLSDLVKYAAAAPTLQWAELDMHWVLGLDCMAFDWHTMKSYQKHDFGFGTPAALRWPHPSFEGFFFVLPTRAGIRNADGDEGIEVCFGLEEKCFAELEKDEEFARYAEQRGLGI